MKRRVCIVVTARPSYSRIKTAMEAVRDHPDLELQLVVAASTLLERYGRVVDVIRSDGFEPSAQVYLVLEGENPTSMAKSTGIGVLELATAFDNLRPDVVVTVADRYETLATAVAASYMNIPLAHVQGGEVTGSIDEKVRHSVTKLADLHLVSTQLAADRVVRMGEDPSTVHVTGCPSIDLASQIVDSPDLDFDPFQRYGGVGADVNLQDGYVVVLQHPVTTEYDQANQQITQTLRAVSKLGLPALWFWPNVDAGSDGTSNAIRSFRETGLATNLHFFKNMAPLDFLRLLFNSRCLVGNSSAGIRECSFLGIPAVNIGTRQTGRDQAGNVTNVGYDEDEIHSAIKTCLDSGRPKPSELYGDGKAGLRIADALSQCRLSVAKRLTY